LFCACATQWRRDLLGQPLGLDYAGVQAAAKMLGIKTDQIILRKLQVLELHELSDGGGKSATQTADKPCRNAHACAMCTKYCDERIGYAEP
jgi:hypothetical protein